MLKPLAQGFVAHFWFSHVQNHVVFRGLVPDRTGVSVLLLVGSREFKQTQSLVGHETLVEVLQ